jgi:hypothetical protein
MYTRDEILKSILFRREIYKTLDKTPDQVKSLRTNYKKGMLKEKTIHEILKKAGFEIVQPELWGPRESR